MYYIDYIDRIAEKSDYENGCDGESVDCAYQYKLESNTIGGLIKLISEHLNIEIEDINIDDCDKSIIFFVKIENVDGSIATEKDIDQWKIGKKILYYVYYSIKVKVSTNFIFDKKSVLDYIE